MATGNAGGEYSPRDSEKLEKFHRPVEALEIPKQGTGGYCRVGDEPPFVTKVK